MYRSGESEYMINGSVCRLKDVNELFYDTGIGKEGYSIISRVRVSICSLILRMRLCKCSSLPSAEWICSFKTLISPSSLERITPVSVSVARAVSMA